MNVVGLMSGTSADGVDAAVISIEGEPPALRWRLLAHANVPHPADLRADIFAGFRATAGAAHLCRLNFALGRALARAALQAIAAAGLQPAQIALIGSHGQTLWHIPNGPDASTLQLGEAALIAELTGITTVSDFRPRDMAAGGQGAPLVAYVDSLLFAHPTRTRAMQNIGGIANVTYLPPGSPAADILAFDTGPGNALIDYAAGRARGGAWACDRDGTLAAHGRVDEDSLSELLADPYFRHRPPKTTGRESFGEAFGAEAWERGKARGLSDEDIVATLTALTARSIARAYDDFLPAFPDEVIFSGGGTLNPTLMTMLAHAFAERQGTAGAPVRLVTTDAYGLPVSAREAVAFAVLAYETAHGRPGNLPAATGARSPVVLGSITPGTNGAFHHRDTEDWPGRQATGPLTEARNPATVEIDRLPTIEVVRLINAEDRRVAAAVAEELPAIADAIDRLAKRLKRGGRLIYIGAGTSGRLGALDAAEWPPTFNTPPGLVTALIAGGTRALTEAIEGGEDDAEAGAHEVADLAVSEPDAVVGIAASGRTPYVLGGMGEARRRGALVIALACVRPSAMGELADVSIAPLAGPEVIAGSTRLKAGTAQKMVLNMLSTGVMIRLGKTYGNLMVDVRATNEKLRGRARRIVQEACDLTPDQAEALLAACGEEIKVAIVSCLAGLSPEAARQRLAASGGVVRMALAEDG